jgi:predicted NBD/HSP70 family sugar kinase
VVEADDRPKRQLEARLRGVGPNNIRQSNQRAVMTVLSVAPGASNAEISRLTGLAPQTVSAVLVDLESEGLLLRGQVRRDGGRGQPATPIFLNPEGAYAIGVEIGWMRLEVVLINLHAEVVGSVRSSHAYPDASTIFAQIGDAVADLTAALPKDRQGRIRGLGLALPSSIGDPDELIAPPAGQEQMWLGLDPAAEVAKATGLDVRLVNDGNAASLAEYVHAPIPRPRNFAYLLVDTLLAAGVFTAERLREGDTGRSGNLGAMVVTDRSGTQRFVYEIASIHALNTRLAEAGLTLDASYGAASGDPAGLILATWIEDAAFVLVQAVLNARTVLEFDLAIIDSPLPPPVLDRIVAAAQRAAKELPSLGRTALEVRKGQLGRSGAASGAALLLIYERLFSRELVHLAE